GVPNELAQLGFISPATGMEDEMLQGILQAEDALVSIGEKEHAPLGKRADVPDVVAVDEDLVLLRKPAVAEKLDAELLAHRAAAAVRADEIGSSHRPRFARRTDKLRCNPVVILLERLESPADSRRYVRLCRDDPPEQGLEGVLRDEMGRLTRKRPI